MDKEKLIEQFANYLYWNLIWEGRLRDEEILSWIIAQVEIFHDKVANQGEE